MHALAERAWQAFRSPSPQALDTLRSSDTSALPFLAAALTRFLQEYPWTRDGLSRTERRLLELARGERVSLLSAFPRMHQGERAYYVSDLTLASIADALSRTSPPLLALDRSRQSTSRVLDAVAALTTTGSSVLAGRLDRVHAGGLDRWLGGVHLQNRQPLWRWDDDRQVMVVT